MTEHQDLLNPSLFTIPQRPVAQLDSPKLTTQKNLTITGQVTQAKDSSGSPILQQAVAKLSWAHNVVLIQKIKDLPTRLWYAPQTLEQDLASDVASPGEIS